MCYSHILVLLSYLGTHPIQKTNPVFFIWSVVGEKIGELTHEKLKQAYEDDYELIDLSVRGGKMLLACSGAGVMLFNMR